MCKNNTTPFKITLNKSCHIWMSHVIIEWVMSHKNEWFCIRMSNVKYEWVMLSTDCKFEAPFYITYQWVTSRMNESCHMSMSHVTYQWAMSHINESCHIWRSHVIYEWVMSHMNESCHIWMSHVTYEWVMSHMNESCHISKSHVTDESVISQMNESRSDPDFKQKQKQGLYQSHSICENLWHLWRSQNVTNSKLWPGLLLWIFFLFFCKTEVVTFWSQMSQMVTRSNVTATNLFLFLFSRQWFGMNEIQQNIQESELCLEFCVESGSEQLQVMLQINEQVIS